MLAAAAVVGRTVDWSRLSPITELGEDDVVAGLRAAVATHLLAADPDEPEGFRWRHALVREAVLAELVAPERTRLACRAADALADRDPANSGPDAALAADLYARGGRPEVAAGLLLRIAARSVASGALQTADEALTKAAHLGGGVAAASARVRVLALSGRVEAAIGVGEHALPDAAGPARVELCLALARAAVMDARWSDATAYLSTTGSDEDPRVMALAADAAYGAGRVEEATALAARAVVAAEDAALPEAQCEALDVVARCLRMVDQRAAGEVLQRAASVAEAHGLVPWRIRALYGLATVELLESDVGTGIEQARELAVRAGMLADVASMGLLLADVRIVVEGPAAAMSLGREVADLAHGLSLRFLEAGGSVVVAWGHAAAGRREEMAASTAAARALAPESPDVTASALATGALEALLEHDLASACHQLDEAVASLRRHASAAPLSFFGLWALVRTLLADRDVEARDELRASDMTARAVNRAGLAYADAVAVGRSGDHAEAVRSFARADSILTTQHWWRRLLRLLALEAAVEDGWGDPAAELRADLAAFDATGEARMARIARELLRRAGAPVPRRGRGDSIVPTQLRAAGVTSREMDVLLLVARGLTNTEIAERLFLSPRTVETHVASLLAKTGARRRAELAPYAPAQTP